MLTKSLGGFGRTGILSKYPCPLSHAAPQGSVRPSLAPAFGTHRLLHTTAQTQNWVQPCLKRDLNFRIWKLGYCSLVVVPGEQKHLLTIEAATEKSNGFFAAYP